MPDRRSMSSARNARKGELAAAVVEQLEALEDLGPNAGALETQPRLRKLGEATLAFAQAVAGDLPLLAELDRQFELLGSVLDVPTRLGAAGETELGVRV